MLDKTIETGTVFTEIGLSKMFPYDTYVVVNENFEDHITIERDGPIVIVELQAGSLYTIKSLEIQLLKMIIMELGAPEWYDFVHRLERSYRGPRLRERLMGLKQYQNTERLTVF